MQQLPNPIQTPNGTYYLTRQTQEPKGKFGGIAIGNRDEDQLPVSVKKVKANHSPDNLKKLQLIMGLKHPNLGDTIDMVNNNDHTYIIREYYPGTDLKTIIKKRSRYRKLTQDFWIKAFIHLLDGIGELHRNGLIHRDIKPSNIILRHPPRSKPEIWKPEDIILIDFEQACIYPAPAPVRSPFALIYSPPEQVLNRIELLNPTSDLFSLAVTLYEVMAGKPPYEDCNAEILLNLQLTYPIKKPAKIDDDLFAILSKAAFKERFPLPPRRLAHDVITDILQKGINVRYQSASEMQTQLEQYINTHKVINESSVIRRWWNRFVK